MRKEKTITIITCDCCGVEFEENSQIMEVKITVVKKYYSSGCKDLELKDFCKNCEDIFLKILSLNDRSKI